MSGSGDPKTTPLLSFSLGVSVLSSLSVCLSFSPPCLFFLSFFESAYGREEG